MISFTKVLNKIYILIDSVEIMPQAQDLSFVLLTPGVILMTANIFMSTSGNRGMAWYNNF